MKWLERYSHGLRVGRRFWAQVVEHRGALVLVAVLAVTTVAFELLRPWPIQWIFDNALVPTGEPARSPLFYIVTGAVAALVFALSRTLSEYAGTLKLTEVGHAVTRSLRLRIFSHLTELSPTFHARHKSGDLLMRLMGDVPMLRTMLVDSTVQMSTRLLQIVGTIAVMAFVEPLLTVVVLALVPLYVFIVRVLSARLTIAVQKQRRKEGELADFLHEAIHATTLIQSLGRSSHAVRRFAKSNRRNARAGLKTARAAARLSASVDALLGVTLAFTLALGSLRVSTGHLSPGELLVFLSYVRGVLKPVRSASKHQARIAKGTACGERILSVLDERRDVRDSAGDEIAPERPGDLSFEGVSYRYPDGALALQDVSVAFRRGELAALFGPSGAGKSTLTSLALRIADPTEGVVRLDGTDLRRFELDSLRERFALSMQDTILFGESLRENLWLGRPDATDDEMETALKLAGAWSLAKERTDSLDRTDVLDTVLGARGTGLSGGESRRICLARAFLRGSPILIADEPFAGLDRGAADVVAAALKDYARSAIVIVVTHEAERLAAFDRVLFLEGGAVVADGSDAELRDGEPRYLKLAGAGASGIA